MKAFLDIDIGDKEAFSRLCERFKVSEAFHKEVGPQLGVLGEFSSLDEDAKLLLAEAFAADPKWASKGEFMAEKPPPLRAGRVTIELYAEQMPKTVENFRCLVTGEKGKGKSSGKSLHYKVQEDNPYNTSLILQQSLCISERYQQTAAFAVRLQMLQGCPLHRVVKGFMAQGGDIVRGDGSSGDSIYGGKFNDEKSGLKIKHDRQGLIGMANSGKNSNTSQFYFTLAEQLPQLNGKHVLFGHICEGLDLLKRIDEEVASSDGRPKKPIWISDCGLL